MDPIKIQRMIGDYTASNYANKMDDLEEMDKFLGIISPNGTRNRTMNRTITNTEIETVIKTFSK